MKIIVRKKPVLYLTLLIFGLSFYSCQNELNIVNGVQENNEESFSSSLIPNKYIVSLDENAIDFPTHLKKKSPIQLSEYIKGVASDLFAKYSDNDVETGVEFIYTHSIIGFSGSMSSETADKLKLDPKVKLVEQDQMVSLGKGGKGGGSSQPQQTVPYGVSRVKGTTYSGNNVAWILDTGIGTDHPDLNVDDSRGFSAFSSGRDASTNDNHGHGTHVSGTIGAINNSIGVVGVAAGVTVIPVKVLDTRGSGSYSGIIAGVDWVAKYGSAGDVANMSLGGGAYTTLDNAVIAASNSSQVKFCIAAGNDGSDANNYSPARANGSYIYTISAINSNDVFASFSNYGNPPVDYAAPGVNIYSTYKGGSYTTMSGTSMAAPHAAGVLLLGAPSSGGTVTGDKDSSPDTIIVH